MKFTAVSKNRILNIYCIIDFEISRFFRLAVGLIWKSFDDIVVTMRYCRFLDTIRDRKNDHTPQKHRFFKMLEGNLGSIYWKTKGISLHALMVKGKAVHLSRSV